MAIIVTIFFGILFFAFLAVFIITIYSAAIGAPFLKTPKKAARQAFGAAGLKKGDKIFDLGAGDGKILIIAEKEFGAQGTGFELSPIFWLAAKINLFLNGCKNSKINCRNFYKYNLGEADAIFCFLSAHAMEKLKSKFETELKPGTKIISYSFHLPGWQAQSIISGYPGKLYLYQK